MSIRRLISMAAVAMLAASVSGCVVRPLWWGHPGYYGRGHYDSYPDRGYRDRGDHNDRGYRDGPR